MSGAGTGFRLGAAQLPPPFTNLQNGPAAVRVHGQVAERERGVAHGGNVAAAELLQQLLDAARVCQDGLAAFALHGDKRERVYAFPDRAAATARHEIKKGGNLPGQ